MVLRARRGGRVRNTRLSGAGCGGPYRSSSLGQGAVIPTVSGMIRAPTASACRPVGFVARSSLRDNPVYRVAMAGTKLGLVVRSQARAVTRNTVGAAVGSIIRWMQSFESSAPVEAFCRVSGGPQGRPLPRRRSRTHWTIGCGPLAVCPGHCLLAIRRRVRRVAAAPRKPSARPAQDRGSSSPRSRLSSGSSPASWHRVASSRRAVRCSWRRTPSRSRTSCRAY